GLVAGLVFRRALAAGPLVRAPGGLRALAARAAASRVAPFAVVVAGAGVYAAVFSYSTVVHHWNGHSRAYDLGLEDSLMWNLVHFNGFFKSSPFTGPTGSHFGNHVYWFAYLMAPIYALAQRPETLLIIQSVLMGAAAIPLYLVAQRRI